MKLSTHQFDYTDIDFTVVAEVHEYLVNFKVYAIEGYEEKGQALWHRKGSHHWPDPVDRLEESETFLHGQVKWDGCSDWHFDEQDRVMLHFCDREGIARISEVMTRCWDLAATLCQND